MENLRIGNGTGNYKGRTLILKQHIENGSGEKVETQIFIATEITEPFEKYILDL